MEFIDDDIMDVIPLCIIPGNTTGTSSNAGDKQGNTSGNSSLPKDMYYTDHAIRRLVTRILSEGHKVEGVSTPLSRREPSPERRPHADKDDDSSRSEIEVATEGLCSLDGAAKWKYVIQRRVAIERELGQEAVEVKEVIELIKNTGLMKTVATLPQCYEGLVKEFIVNIPEDIHDKNSREFCKVFVRGKCVKFSPNVINKFLGRGMDGGVDLETTDNEVCRTITTGQVKEWPSRNHLSAGKLSVKYAILHKIGSANWIPTNHASTISINLGRIIHAIGTRLPIAFPSLICGIILSQQPGILSTSDIPSRRKSPLSIHYKLFEGSHVNDVMTSAKREPASKGSLIDQLKETCKELDNGIRVAKARKEALEVLICSLEKEEVEKTGNDSTTRSKSQSSGGSGSPESSEGTGEDEDEGEEDSSSD
ncbi:uncharacterized protein LOC127122976 [Lathyrus oleraceus]|uniref:uncharacterized protein LOC127122976 n=1 Tax=Pisum sativum TaxID=3888 RepID=UPI0021CEACBB|nr:uncharacterized protein LOC127122976 [Pisum sativum]